MKLIPLTQGKYAKIDDDIFDYLNQWKWHIVNGNNTFYAVRWITQIENKKRKLLYKRSVKPIHRLLTWMGSSLGQF